MAHTTIKEVFTFRELTRTDDSGATTTVDLIIGNPEPQKDPVSGVEYFICSVQILGLQPETAGAPIETGFKFLDRRGLDPLAALLGAVYSARAVLDASPEGLAGKLVWKDMFPNPGYGLPKMVIELTEFVRANYINFPPAQQAMWDGLLQGVPIAKNGMVTTPYQPLSWDELLAAPITALQAMSAAEAGLFNRIGITTVGELANYLPFRVANSIRTAANPTNVLLG